MCSASLHFSFSPPISAVCNTCTLSCALLYIISSCLLCNSHQTQHTNTHLHTQHTQLLLLPTPTSMLSPQHIRSSLLFFSLLRTSITSIFHHSYMSFFLAFFCFFLLLSPPPSSPLHPLSTMTLLPCCTNLHSLLLLPHPLPHTLLTLDSARQPRQPSSREAVVLHTPTPHRTPFFAFSCDFPTPISSSAPLPNTYYPQPLPLRHPHPTPTITFFLFPLFCSHHSLLPTPIRNIPHPHTYIPHQTPYSYSTFLS